MRRTYLPNVRKRRIRSVLLAGLILIVPAALVSKAADRHRQTALLREAVRKHDANRVWAALTGGADPNASMTPSSFGFAETMRVLFHRRKPPTPGDTVFMYAVDHCDSRIVQSLLEAGGDVHAQDFMGATALNRAAYEESGHPTVNRNLVLLIAHGADTNHSDAIGPPLSATADKPLDCAYLLAHGADPNLPNQRGKTPLMLACAVGNLQTTRALLRAGANIDLRSSEGGTALMLATWNGRSEIALLLLASGADPTIQDQSGRTAADYANAQLDNQVLRTIRQYRKRITDD